MSSKKKLLGLWLGLAALTTVAQAEAGGWLGVHPEPQPVGVLIGDVIKSSPADRFGLRRHDTILMVNGVTITSMTQFNAEIFKTRPGQRANLLVQRRGMRFNVRPILETAEEHKSSLAALSANNPPQVTAPLSTTTSDPFAFNRTTSGQNTQTKRAFQSPGHSHDFESQLKGTKSLLSAYDRIREEKQLGEAGQKTSQQIQQLIVQAEDYLHKYQLDEGMRILDQAYTMARTAVAQLRHGETLTHSLNFNSPQEEYLYELDRNTTYQMLSSQVAFSQGEQDPTVITRLQDGLHVRQEGERLAQQGLFKEAIVKLENSSKLLADLSREMGVNIPE